VSQQVDPLQAEMGAQRVHVADQPVGPECGRVGRVGRPPHAAGVEQDQPPPPAEAAQVAQVFRRPPRPARQADHRRPVTGDPVRQHGLVV
jgi:hypothetical protein